MTHPTKEQTTTPEPPWRWLLVGDSLVPLAAIPTRMWLDWAWEHGEEVDHGIHLSSRFWSSPKLASVGFQGRWVFLAGLAYSAKYGLNGRVPKTSIPCLTHGEDATEAVKELVSAGLWIEDGDAYALAETEEADEFPEWPSDEDESVSPATQGASAR